MSSRRNVAQRLTNRRGLALIGSAGLLLAVGAGLIAPAAGTDPNSCFRSQAGAPVIAEFQIPDGAAIRDHLPSWGKAPELDFMRGPLTVLVFQGKHVAVPVFPMLIEGDAPPPVFEDVVCVVTADGEETYYVGVDLTGLKP